MRQVLTCIFLLCHCALAAQLFPDPAPFAAGITAESLRRHLEVIASPDMQGRETATEGQRKAADYLGSTFRQIGLAPGWNGGYQQTFPVYQDSLVGSLLAVDGEILRQDTDYVVSPKSSYNIAFMASEVLFVGYGLSDSIRDDYAQVNARGKIVMVMPGSETRIVRGKRVRDPLPSLQQLQQAAQKNGAIAMLIVDRNLPARPQPAQDLMYSSQGQPTVPNTFFISDSVARMIMGTDYYVALKIMETGPPPPKSCYVSVRFELNKVTARLESSNVIGTLEGTDRKEECIVISAHYDHLGMRDSVIYHGADDDGSGTAALVEMARAFAEAAAKGMRPRRSIVFLAVSGEEKGLWGSAHYTENPAFPLSRTSVNINIDMIGRIEEGRKEDSLNYIYVVGDHRISSDLRRISEDINNRYFFLRLDYRFNNPDDPQRIFYRSDHINFIRKGVPAIFYFSGLHKDYHKPSDTPDKINYPLLAKRTRLIFHTAWEFANRESMLERDLD